MPFWCISRRRRRNVMISWRQEMRHAAFRRKAIDQRNKAHVPFFRILSMRHSIARLQYESHRVICVSEALNLGEHGINDQRVLILNSYPIAPAPRIAVYDE